MTQRTSQQRKSIEVYCRELAKALDEKGLDVQTVITAPVQLTQDNVKKHMFKVIMKALYPDYVSTTELSTTEVQEVYENLNRITGERYGVSMPFPSYEEQLNNERVK